MRNGDSEYADFRERLEEAYLAADLEEDAEGRQDDGDDEVHERRRPVGHRRPIDPKHRRGRRKGGERMGGDETTRCQRGAIRQV